MFNLITMTQGQHKTDDSLNNLFDSNLTTLDLAVGRQILCSKETMDRSEDYPTDKEFKLEEESSKGMSSIKR